jgi:hypothetical protein
MDIALHCISLNLYYNKMYKIKLTAWSRIFLEKLIVTQLVKSFYTVWNPVVHCCGQMRQNIWTDTISLFYVICARNTQKQYKLAS